MKDFKLPQLSEEEKNNIFKSLKSGDELLIIDYSIWSMGYKIVTVKVKNVTAKGNVRLDNNGLLKYLPSNYYPKSNISIQDCVNQIIVENNVLNNINKLPREHKTFSKNLEYEDAIVLNNILNKIFKDAK